MLFSGLPVFFVLLSAFGISPAFCGPTPRIVGGSDAAEGETSWMAALLIAGEDPANGHFCGGTLIHENWVVTAAHCLVSEETGPLSPDDVEVGLGSVDLESASLSIHRVRRIIVHPEYDPVKIDADIGLIELETASSLTPAGLKRDVTDFAGQTGRILGWGSTSSQEERYPVTLKQAYVPIVTNARCNEIYNARGGYDDDITDNMMCAGYETGSVDSCTGDSGGPLMVMTAGSWRLAGVVSWGDGCATPGFYGVYTRLSRFFDFVDTYVPEAGEYPVSLVFPHAAVTGGWRTEIALINPGPRAVSGVLAGLDENGRQVFTESVELNGFGRRRFRFPDDFPWAASLSLCRFAGVTGNAHRPVTGYLKFYKDGNVRGAVPAVIPGAGSSDGLSIPHIARGSGWWTGLSLTNTGTADALAEIRMDTAETPQARSAALAIPAGGRRAVTVFDLFGFEAESAVSGSVTGLPERAGLLLFGTEAGDSRSYLAGLPLGLPGARNLVFPHIASGGGWWTGLALRNTEAADAVVSFRFFSVNGVDLGEEIRILPGHERLSLTAASLGVPAGAAWIRASADRELTGIQLFGGNDGGAMAGLAARSEALQTGVFPCIDPDGWTGIALVNPGDTAVSVELRAMSDSGSEAGRLSRTAAARGKIVGTVAGLFDKSALSADWIYLESDGPVSGFQLNGDDGGRMLDGLPLLNAEQ